jgi:Domain of unknown function (DUF4124)
VLELRSLEMTKRVAIATGVLIALSAISVATAAGKIYKWVDANGQVHFSDHAPPEPAADKDKDKDKSEPAPKPKTPAQVADDKHPSKPA